jgi:hypothetical protein
MRRLLTALAIACLAAPAAASADSGVNKLLTDACKDEHIDGRYTQAQYKKALEQLPTDADEYTACRDILQRGRLAALGSGKKSNGGGGSNGTTGTSGGGGTTGGGGGGGAGGGGTGSSGTSAAPNPDPIASATPAQKKAIAAAGQTAKPVNVGGELVQPGELGVGAIAGSGSGNSVPTPLAALMVLLAAGALCGGGWWLWRSVLARRFG